MAVCPKCKENINTLNCAESAVRFSKVRIFSKENNSWLSFSDHFTIGVGDKSRYSCPNCFNELFDNSEDAKSFLESGDK